MVENAMQSVGTSVGGAGIAALAGQTGSARGPGRDEFLLLLIAQIQHQNPLEPLKDQEFIAQLAQFNTLEQVIQLNRQMETLLKAETSNYSLAATGLIGKEVTVLGSAFTLGKSGSATLSYALKGDAAKVTLEVLDRTNKVVRTVDLGPQKAGDQAFTFDGNDAQGKRLPEGDYTFRVTATDAKGGTVAVETRTTGVVTGVTFEGGFPFLLIGSRKIALGEVLEVRTPSGTAS